MRITKLELENFKRFTKLTIDMTQLSTPPKLVLLIGANGSGKSSVFDALNVLKNEVSKKVFLDQSLDKYYRKNVGAWYSINITDEKGTLYGDLNNKNTGRMADLSSFYGRTSLRQVPRLTRLAIKNGFNVENDTDRPLAWIDRDERFENDVEKTTLDIQKLLFDVTKTVSNQEIISQYINPINAAFSRIFKDGSKTSISYLSIIPPGDGKVAELLFKKGESTIDYNLLSSGEKEVFNILLNLSVRGKYYQDTIYFIDEMDLHLEYNTQKAFLKEITENWIPDTCQLWTASHSLGFIQYANESEYATIIDLDNLDFDLEQTIYPTPKNNTEVYEIAVSKEFLGTVFSGKELVFSEGKDSDLYNSLAVKDVLFTTEKGAKNNKELVFLKSQNLNYYGILDRDFLNDAELSALHKKYPKLIFLQYYSIENYLYHPDNLSEYFSGIHKEFDKEDYIRQLSSEKSRLINDMVLKGIASIRSSYQFLFKQGEDKKQLELFNSIESAQPVFDMLKSDDFETFYQVFPAKDYGKNISARQNLKSLELIKTAWIKNHLALFIENQIKNVISGK